MCLPHFRTRRLGTLQEETEESGEEGVLVAYILAQCTRLEGLIPAYWYWNEDTANSGERQEGHVYIS